jgi:hypothetical protein
MEVTWSPRVFLHDICLMWLVFAGICPDPDAENRRVEDRV